MVFLLDWFSMHRSNYSNYDCRFDCTKDQVFRESSHHHRGRNSDSYNATNILLGCLTRFISNAAAMYSTPTPLILFLERPNNFNFFHVLKDQRTFSFDSMGAKRYSICCQSIAQIFHIFCSDPTIW